MMEMSVMEKPLWRIWEEFVWNNLSRIWVEFVWKKIGLRMLIGGVVREAAVLGHHITPLFLYYAYHGPAFWVLLRLNRGKLHDSRWWILVFVSYLVLLPLFDCDIVTLLFITTIVIAAGIMVLLAIATSVEIPMNFLGTDLVRWVAPAACQRYGVLCLRLTRCGF
jgi:hypothetical protein